MAAPARSQIRLYSLCIIGISSDGDVLMGRLRPIGSLCSLVVIVAYMFGKCDGESPREQKRRSEHDHHKEKLGGGLPREM